MRRQGASIFIYLIFILLIVIFVYGLAPSNRGGREGGCTSSSNVPVVVDGQDASQTAFLVAFSADQRVNGRQKVYFALDWVIRRELLAQAAAARGLRTTGDQVDEEIKKGWFFLGGHRIDFSQSFFKTVGDEKFFDIKQFKNWVGQLNVSMGSYREEQARDMQAALMEEILRGSVRVSRDEALADYLYENNTVTYDTVAFEPDHYRAAMKLSDADVQRFLDGHTAEVEARFKADGALYKAVKPQYAIREIFIPKAYPQAAKPADDKKPDDKKSDDKKPDDKSTKADDKKPADKKPDDKSAKADDKKPADKKPDDKTAKTGAPDNPRGLPIEAAKAKLEAVRADIAAGKLKFTDAEKQLAADSSDDAPKDNGDRGWRVADNPALEDPALNDAVKKLKPGEMTPVIVTERGVYLAIATDKREGDLSFTQVKTEIAGELAKDAWSKEAAKRDALAALAEAQGGKALDKMFEHPTRTLDDMLNDPNMPEQQRQMIEKLKQQKQQLHLQHPKHSELEVHETDIPVGWFADADGASGSGAAAPAAGAAAPAAGTGSAAAPAAGAAAPAAGTGSAAAPATGTGSAAAPAAG
ncbi:MAG TPA: peptidylprolyl isomerase, partial [Kofleriaceae bacterium]|nr:peptidylprolyl isomerase [Kofleriaceae bacterium]